MAKMVTQGGRNLAAGLFKTHLGQHLMWSVQCKARTASTKPKTTTTTTSTQADPNTHSICQLRDTWKPCSNCYSYIYTHYFFYNYETYYDYDEKHTCTYSISKKCNPNFVGRFGFNCKGYANGCQSGGRKSYLDSGIMTEDGYMTAFNCPQCGCTEENGPIRPDFATLRE